MFQILRPRPGNISKLHLVSVNVLKNVLECFKYSTLIVKLTRVKANPCCVDFHTLSLLSSNKAGSPNKAGYDQVSSTCKTRPKFTTTNIDRTKIIKAASRILQCSEEETVNLYQNNEHLAKLNASDLKTRLEKLQLYGIDIATIKENIWILSINSYQLSSRLELLKKWKFTNLNNAVGLIQLPFTKLKNLTRDTEKNFVILDGQNKICYFSSFTKCGEKVACDLFLKYPFMMRINVESFKAILCMAKDMGVLKEDLLSDPWLFQYSPKFIENRIHVLIEINAREKCKVIKPWMLRCTPSTLNRYFELREENIAALGSYTNLKDLLSNELDLSDAEVEDMFVKHPPLAKISYSKAKEMIDFLKTEGFNTKMIYQVPRVLCHKQATLLARMLELKKINPRMMSLQNLCRNKKDYLAFLNKVQCSHS